MLPAIGLHHPLSIDEINAKIPPHNKLWGEESMECPPPGSKIPLPLYNADLHGHRQVQKTILKKTKKLTPYLQELLN